MSAPLQPLLHDETVLLRAPAQCWSGADGDLGEAAIHGVYVSDVRLLRAVALRVDDVRPEPIARQSEGSSAMAFVALVRHLDGPGADPDVRLERRREVTTDGLRERVVIRSRRAVPVVAEIDLRLEPDASSMDLVKAGLTGAPPAVRAEDGQLSWSAEDAHAEVVAPGARTDRAGDAVHLRWRVHVPPRGEAAVEWRLRGVDRRAVVQGAAPGSTWIAPQVSSGDERLRRWLDRSLDDLEALRLRSVEGGDDVFLAAGAPWFSTLFGRDSIWAARFLLPLGTELAAGTLRTLAALQGRRHVAGTAEQPGKIMHELRRGELTMPGEGIALPPLYYGTVDATPLWVCLLHDAWRWGMDEDEVRALLPNLRAALGWMRDHGDSDGDGLLEYVDETGSGLSNQGWKDSGDSIQWRDGRLAEGPIALCEVQGYAYEAARHGADLLDALGEPGAEEWRAWAERLRSRFHEAFWVADADGSYPAIALDAAKRPVDAVTSNMGHLLGTGLLDPEQALLVARRLVGADMSSGFGLRTLSSGSDGYWPLSYHGGAVWTHDTAIAVAGLVREGRRDEAAVLIDGLLAAAAAFDYRVPELHSGDAGVNAPAPYPAACRPQAWSAAASVQVLSAILGLAPDAPGGRLAVRPLTPSPVGALSVRGLRFAGAAVDLSVDAEGDVVDAAGASVAVW